MERILGEMENRSSGCNSFAASRDDFQKYMDYLNRDCFGYSVFCNFFGEPMVAFSDTYWCPREHDCPTDRELPTVEDVEEVGR